MPARAAGLGTRYEADVAAHNGNRTTGGTPSCLLCVHPLRQSMELAIFSPHKVSLCADRDGDKRAATEAS